MDKLKKASFIIVFACAILASFFGFGNKISKNNQVYAETEKIVLNVKKVTYSNSEIVKTNETSGEPLLDENGQTIPKSLGEYSQQELFENKEKIMQNSSDITSGDVISLKPQDNEAIFVYLSPSDSTSIIKLLSPSLTVSANGKTYNALISSYNINNNLENRVFIMALDFNSLVDDLGLEFDYSNGAHFSFAFNYSYTTNATNIISESKEFEFYLINYNNFFDIDNKYQVLNCEKAYLDSEEYFYNKSIKNFSSIKFNPYKFSPNITYSYNETTLNLNVVYDIATKQFMLVSSNENIFESKKIEIFDADSDYPYAKLELSRIGKYEINYDIVVFEQDGLNIVDNSKTQSIEEMKNQTVYNFGYEALYKNYLETDTDIKAQNQDYKPLYDDNFESDYSYYTEKFYDYFEVSLNASSYGTYYIKKNNAFEKVVLNSQNTYDETETYYEFKPSIDKIALELNTNSSFVSSISKTNQAPVKLNSYVTENLSGAKYYIFNKNNSGNYTFGSNEYSFSQSKRFETSGIYVVTIPYKFENFSNQTFYKIFIFKIENTTPEIKFYSDENFSSLINSNGFTNNSVYVAFNKQSTDPFSLPNKLKFVRNNAVLVEGKDYEIVTTSNKFDYVKFDANDANSNGTYLVQLTYGTSEITVEKRFVIDTTKIQFKVVEVNKDNINNKYEIISDSTILDNSNEQDNSSILKAETDNNFALFIKNKNVENNIISVKYDYVALNSQKSQSLYEIEQEIINQNTKLNLLVYNNFQLNNIFSGLTYSNNTINNLSNFDNISISSNNTNAVLSISALYRFVVSDLAGNQQIFYVLKDNSENVVLESNDKIVVEKINDNYKLVVENTKQEASLNVKQNELNLVSNNYSLIFGDYKAIEFKIDSNNEYLAEEYFGKTFDTTNIVYEKILRKNDKPTINKNILGNYTDAEIEEINNYLVGIEDITSNNIFSITPQDKEVDCKYSFSLNNTSCSFELNTDRNRILVFTSLTGNRIFQSNPTNEDNIYITFKNDITDASDDYYLESLTLTFYPFVETNEQITWGEKEEFNLLDNKESGGITYNNAQSGDYIIKPLVTTYVNGKYISKEGKYVITKKYKGENLSPVSQTYYIDRKSPVGLFDENSDIMIGSNLNITFDNQELDASTIVNYIINNRDLTTNMLHFNFTNSENQNFVYKYSALDDLDKKNFQIKYKLYQKINDQEIEVSDNILSKGTYTLIIYDNSNFDNNGDIQIDKTNQVKLNINVDAKSPQGNFVKNKTESLENIKSTNANLLSFEFEDSESEFIYNIDLKNIVLKQNNKVIFKTTETEQKTYFNLDDGTKIYYISAIGNVFSFTKSQIGQTNRYRYSLTILDPDKNSDALFKDGKSLEAVYKLEISYDYNKDKYPLIFENQSFGESSYEMIIDHTPPKSNFLNYIEADKFLTETEKQALISSILNKNIDDAINFDNYVFVVSTSPKYLENSDSSIDYTDTSNIYTRNYDKYNSNNTQDQQSLIEGDARFDDQTISRYRFDINTVVNGQLLYRTVKYNSDANNFFTSKEGYYEIIEMDEAENYTIYTVYFVEPDNGLKLSANYETSAGTFETTSNEINLTDANFALNSINCIENDFLNVKVSINENASNSEVYNLRYIPFSVNSTEYEYFNNIESLVSRINKILSSYSQLNTYGNVYKIEISNRVGNTLTIINSTPNKEFEIKDYVKNINDSIILTIPSIKESATKITNLKVYAVIDGKYDKSKPLSTDSVGTAIDLEQNSVYTFTNNIVVDRQTISVSVYYFEWTDNFNRTQKIVRYLGEKSESKFTFDDYAFFVIKDDENYTQYYEGIYFEFNPNLYEIKIEYYDYSSKTSSIIIQNLSELKVLLGDNYDFSKLDLFNILVKHLQLNEEEYANDYQVKLTATLTDLTKLDETINDSVYSYIYYSVMPNFEFTDSSGNVLQIYDNSDAISTSKNVHLNYVNNTLFNISSIIVEREYTLNNEIVKESFEITSYSYTFSALGSYKIIATNELSKQNVFRFNITTATNKTYTIMTNEQNMTNFEVSFYGITENIKLNENSDVETTFEVYYSIYNTELVVNSDFNLTKEKLTSPENYKDYDLYVVKQKNENYKFVAIKKVDYNSNFLNFLLDNQKISFFDADRTDYDLSGQISGYTLTYNNGVGLNLPLYNGNQNKIVLKVYYNNEPISLNANIYETTDETQTLTLNNVPAGVYSIYFEDYAGNTQLFNGNSFLNVAVLTEIAIKINDELPVDYQIYNTNVNLSIVNEKQYISDKDKGLTIKVYLNNNEITKNIKKDTNKNYIFTEYGFYKVILSGYVSSMPNDQIIKEIHFTILNNYEALKNFSFVSLNGQNITKIVKDGTDITTELKKILSLYSLLPIENELAEDAETELASKFNDDKVARLKTLLAYDDSNFENSYLYNLTLSSEILYPYAIKYSDNAEVETIVYYPTLDNAGNIMIDNNGNIICPQEEELDGKQIAEIVMQSFLGGGEYEIYVKNQNIILGETEFSFKVWIRDKNAKIKINSSLAEGGETSKEITLSYNPYLIYTQIGECGIYINDTLITKIDNTSLNNVNTYKITKEQKGTYIIQVKSASGNTELSFVLNKKEPLSTVSIIVIVVACLLAVGGVILFIKLRTKMKVK